MRDVAGRRLESQGNKLAENKWKAFRESPIIVSFQAFIHARDVNCRSGKSHHRPPLSSSGFRDVFVRANLRTINPDPLQIFHNTRLIVRFPKLHNLLPIFPAGQLGKIPPPQPHSYVRLDPCCISPYTTYITLAHLILQLVLPFHPPKHSLILSPSSVDTHRCSHQPRRLTQASLE